VSIEFGSERYFLLENKSVNLEKIVSFFGWGGDGGGRSINKWSPGAEKPRLGPRLREREHRRVDQAAHGQLGEIGQEVIERHPRANGTIASYLCRIFF
jgi:hypothetical protein